MEITITKWYLFFVLVLWLLPTASALYGAPIWITVLFLTFFAIYVGHEWMHAWVCSINNLDVASIDLVSGRDMQILFEEPEGPDKERIESDVFLVGAVWDSIWYSILILNSIFYALSQGDYIPLVCGIIFIFVLIGNLAWPGSDWQHYLKIKRTTLRA